MHPCWLKAHASRLSYIRARDWHGPQFQHAQTPQPRNQGRQCSQRDRRYMPEDILTSAGLTVSPAPWFCSENAEKLKAKGGDGGHAGRRGAWHWPFVGRRAAASRSRASTWVIGAATRSKMGDMCHAADLWDLAGACLTGAVGPAGFSTALQIPGCHINPPLNPTSLLQWLTPTSFFHLSEQPNSILRSWKLFSSRTKHTVRGKLVAFLGGDGQICV